MMESCFIIDQPAVNSSGEAQLIFVIRDIGDPAPSGEPVIALETTEEWNPFAKHGRGLP